MRALELFGEVLLGAFVLLCIAEGGSPQNAVAFLIGCVVNRGKKQSCCVRRRRRL